MTSRPLTEAMSAEEQASSVRPGSRQANVRAAGPANPALTSAAQPNPVNADQPRPSGPGQRNASWRPPAALSGAASTGGYLAVASRRGARQAPTSSGLVRRRLMINASKFVLPVIAVLLLSSIALWPEFDTTSERTRFSVRGLSATMDGARLTDAHYNGVDERGRPFTVTAATAAQKEQQRFDLTRPIADVTLENGTWLNVKSKQGVYFRKDQQLDLSHDVVLYRDDGTTMTTESATVALKDGAASGSMPTHIEGPFGILDATGFTTVEKGAAIQFWGPVRVEMNGVSK